MYIIQQCWEKMLNQSQSRGNDPTLKVETVTQSPRHGEIPIFTQSNITSELKNFNEPGEKKLLLSKTYSNSQNKKVNAKKSYIC